MALPDAAASPSAASLSAASLSIERTFGFSLLGLLASGFLAVAGSGYLDQPTIVLMTAVLLVQAFSLARQRTLRVSKRGINLACLAYCAFFIADALLISPTWLHAVVHLIFFLEAVTAATGTEPRDHLFLAAVSFGQLVAAAILSVNPNFFIFLACYLLAAIATLTSAEIRRSLRTGAVVSRSGQKRFHPRLAVLSTWIAAGILALTAGLFFLLPRTADAALAHLFRHRFIVPGFSGRVTLGQSGQLHLDSRPVMHVSSARPESIAGLKWRGDALSHFDGIAWTNRPMRWTPLDIEQPSTAAAAAPAATPSGVVDYQVELDSAGSRTLFFAGAPQVVRMLYPQLDRSETDSFRLRINPPQGYRYEVSSVLEGRPENAAADSPPAGLDEETRRRNLQLPPLDPRISALAFGITATANTDLARARAIERWLRANYVYALETPANPPADPLADFLFTRRRGYCEYFASAMAVMLRSSGVPARVAVGFQSGMYNPITGRRVIRASDAHAWVEAWLPESGWTTFDPTPPSAGASASSLAAKLDEYLDAAGTFWQEWVLTYDPRRPGSLVDRVQAGAGNLNFHWLSELWRAGGPVDRAAGRVRPYGPAISIALLLAIALWLAGPRAAALLRMRLRLLRVRRGNAAAGDATLLYQQMLAIVKRRGYQKPPWFTPAEFAASLPHTGFGAAVGEFTAVYNAVRFGGRTEAAPRLSALLDQLEKSLA